MATVDTASNIYLYQSIPPKAFITSAAGTAVNTQGFESVTMFLSIGAYTDGEYAIQIEDSPDNNSDWSVVLPSSGFLINVANFPYSLTSTDYTITSIVSEDAIFWIGYVGPNQYVRAHIYASGTTDGMLLEASFILGWPHTAPTQLTGGNQVG